MTSDLPLLLAYGVLALAPITFLSLMFLPAPYGRHARRGFGPTISTRVAWLVMEMPASLVFAAAFLASSSRVEPVPLILFSLFQLHYVHRAFIYPFQLRASASRRTPVLIVALGFAFNVVNGYANGAWVAGAGYDTGWLADPRFVVGAVLFLTGFGINRWADGVLRRLRRPGEATYRIPRGGLYDWVSCPNYLGEMIEWAGWALATWSVPGLAFAVFTVANLFPRALAHHRWYRRTFPDYPGRRRAVLPGLV